MRRAPAGATEWSSRDFRSPGRGSDSIFTTNRWFAPPANFQCPFGTSRSLSSSNSRYAMRSRRFEVEDFAKQVPCGSAYQREITSHLRPHEQIRYDPLPPEDAQSIPVDEGPWRCVLLGLHWVA